MAGPSGTKRYPIGIGLDPADLNRWDKAAVEDYREWVTQNGLSYVKTSEKWDCADFAMTVVIDYAKKHDLPVRFNRVDGLKSWVYSDVHMTEEVCSMGLDECWRQLRARPYEDLEAEAHPSIAAAHLLDTDLDNTVEIRNIADLKPGDLIILNQAANHVQLVYANPSKVTCHEPDGSTTNRKVLELLQGNSPPREIAYKAWDIDKQAKGTGYLVYDTNKQRWQPDAKHNYLNLEQMWQKGEAHGRRWNVSRFNQVKGN